MDELSQPARLKKLPRLKPRGGLKVMYAAIRALLLRELQTRFGHYRLGYLWVFLEPFFSIGLMMVVFGTVMQRAMPGIDYVVFLLNGTLPFFMFRTGVMQSMSAVQANKGLFSYKPVKPIDALLARNFLEFILSIIVYFTFSIALIWFNFKISFDYIPQLLFYWGLLFLFMVSCSLVFMVIGDFSKELEKFLTVFFFILYFLSGTMYSMHMIPSPYRDYLLWNPLVHIFELMRHAVAPTYSLVSGISLTYFLLWIIFTSFVGLLLYKRFEKRLVKSR